MSDTNYDKANLSVNRCMAWAQWITLGAAVLASLYAIKTYEEQSRFNRDSQQPWIYYDFDERQQAPDIDSLGNTTFHYRVVNVGLTPACSIKLYSKLTLLPEFPDEDIARAVAADENPRAPHLFPQKQFVSEASTHFLAADPLQPRTLRTKKAILQAMEIEKIHLHLYVAYSDYAGKRYGVRQTFFMDCHVDTLRGLAIVKAVPTYTSIRPGKEGRRKKGS